MDPHVKEVEITTLPRRGKDQLSRKEVTETANTPAPVPEVATKAGETASAKGTTTSPADTALNPVIVTLPTVVQAAPSPENEKVNALMVHAAVRENATTRNGLSEM